jgi:hypothetical protein
MKYLLALSVLATSPAAAKAQYIMQPSLGGTPSYGAESKSEDIQSTNRKTKKTAHRGAPRNQRDLDTRGSPSPLPRQ